VTIAQECDPVGVNSSLWLYLGAIGVLYRETFGRGMVIGGLRHSMAPQFSPHAPGAHAVCGADILWPGDDVNPYAVHAWADRIRERWPDDLAVFELPQDGEDSHSYLELGCPCRARRVHVHLVTRQCAV
jgi:hypothetical protein